MKKALLILSLVFPLQTVLGQELSTTNDSIANYFKETKTATSKYKSLWNIDLFGPIILVNPNTRQVYSNIVDTVGVLKPKDNIFNGILPNEINIANTAINWNGRRWAMIILPLPINKQDRVNLLVHELFHLHQPALGFQVLEPGNNHLDQKEGRIYMRLELEALKKSLKAPNKFEQKIHLINALLFRKYRHSLYLGADTTENLLEINEGVAEYTGFALSGRNKKQILEHFSQTIDYFLSNPTFVRSFAYQTIPVYGYLLGTTKRNWNKDITNKTNLTDYFAKAFNISVPADLRKTAGLLLNQYNGEVIISEEKAREEKAKRIIAEFKNKFVTQPHFELAFEKMNISFDPGNIMPLEDIGTVYPNMRITDNWGILTVKNGALIGSNWDRISVTIPINIENNNINGDGWTLELKDGYSVTKDELTGNYKVAKK